MFLDFHRTSKGQYVVIATVTGSYGETIRSQVGRSNDKVRSAAMLAIKLAAAGKHKDVTLMNRITKHVTYIDPVAARLYLKQQGIK